MENVKQEPQIKEYAGGWMTERAGTEVPGFLKLAFIVIAGGCLTYFFLFMYGETTHEDRGVLVRQMNAATEASVAAFNCRTSTPRSSCAVSPYM